MAFIRQVGANCFHVLMCVCSSSTAYSLRFPLRPSAGHEVPCDGCRKLCPRNCIGTHQRWECPATLVPCSVPGCREMVRRDARERHEDDPAHMPLWKAHAKSCQAREESCQAAAVTARLDATDFYTELLRKLVPGPSIHGFPRKSNAEPVVDSTTGYVLPAGWGLQRVVERQNVGGATRETVKFRPTAHPTPEQLPKRSLLESLLSAGGGGSGGGGSAALPPYKRARGQ
jgi:hypothetical protein